MTPQQLTETTHPARPSPRAGSQIFIFSEAWLSWSRLYHGGGRGGHCDRHVWQRNYLSKRHWGRCQLEAWGSVFSVSSSPCHPPVWLQQILASLPQLWSEPLQRPCVLQGSPQKQLQALQGPSSSLANSETLNRHLALFPARLGYSMTLDS